MTVDAAIAKVEDAFPVRGYMEKMDSSYRNVAEVVLRNLAPGSSILDFGSGPCEKAAILSVLGYKCSAHDDLEDEWHLMDDNVARIEAFAKMFGVNFSRGDGKTIPFERESFDMVMLHCVVEHLHDSPRYLLNSLIKLLRPGGLLFITVPNAGNIRKRWLLLSGGTNYPRFEAYYWSRNSWRGHVREYVISDLAKLSAYLRLETVELRSCHHRIAQLGPVFRAIFRGVTVLLPAWRDSWSLVCRKPIAWAPADELPEAEWRRVLAREAPYPYLEDAVK